MPLPGELQLMAQGDADSFQPSRTLNGTVKRYAGHDNSGVDLHLIEDYLQQLLPALSSAVPDTAANDGSVKGIASLLHLDRAALLSAGVPQHTINALYRALAAHAGAFRKLVAVEVQQLRQLLSQQPGLGPQLQSTIQLLDGPIASAAAPPQVLQAGRTQSLQQQQEKQQQLLQAMAAESITAAAGAPKSSSVDGQGLGPTANDLVKDYAEVYATMKQTMEVRLRHEQRRGDFLQNKLQQTEGSLRDTTAQLDTTNRQLTEQRAESHKLSEEIPRLQSNLAASHAAFLALQQEHKQSMEQAAMEKQQTEQLHDNTVEGLRAELAAAKHAAAGLEESNRQVEALRLLYNEELSRASRLAVELTRATTAADKAAAEEDGWRRKLQKSDSRADNAEGLAEAMRVTVSQLEQELTKQNASYEAKKDESSKLRLMLERSRLAAVQQRALAHSTVVQLAAKVDNLTSDLSAKQASLLSVEDNLKLKAMELDGANTQLKASRNHLKQLMSDLEAEQEKSAGLKDSESALKQQVDELTVQKEMAEGRMKTLQLQLSKANDSSALMSQQLTELRGTVEQRAAEVDELQDALQAEAAAHGLLREQAGKLRMQIAELQVVQQQHSELQEQHADINSKLEHLEQENMDLTAKARQLQLTTAELQQLQQSHAKLQTRIAAVQQELVDTGSSLGRAEKLRNQSEAQVVLLQDKLQHADLASQHLSRQLLAVTTAGDGAQRQVEQLRHQLESVQAALQAAEGDRQVLAAQRDGWMASFQEAYGKLQEWTASSQAASQKLAGRATMIQSAMQQLNNQIVADIAGSDGLAASRHASIAGGRASFLVPSTAGSVSSAGGAASEGLSAATAGVLDQMSGLQQLMQAEADKHRQEFADTLEALSKRVQERHQAAQNWWQETLAAARSKKAAKSWAAAAKKHGGTPRAPIHKASHAGSSLITGQQPPQTLLEIQQAGSGPQQSQMTSSAGSVLQGHGIDAGQHLDRQGQQIASSEDVTGNGCCKGTDMSEPVSCNNTAESTASSTASGHKPDAQEASARTAGDDAPEVQHVRQQQARQGQHRTPRQQVGNEILAMTDPLPQLQQQAQQLPHAAYQELLQQHHLLLQQCHMLQGQLQVQQQQQQTVPLQQGFDPQQHFIIIQHLQQGHMQQGLPQLATEAPHGAVCPAQHQRVSSDLQQGNAGAVSLHLSTQQQIVPVLALDRLQQSTHHAVNSSMATTSTITVTTTHSRSSSISGSQVIAAVQPCDALGCSTVETCRHHSSSQSIVQVQSANLVAGSACLADVAVDQMPPQSSMSQGPANCHNNPPATDNGVLLSTVACQQAELQKLQQPEDPQAASASAAASNESQSGSLHGAAPMSGGLAAQFSSFLPLGAPSDLLQGSPSAAFLLDSPRSPPGSLPGGDFLAGFVSMVAYQEQMKSVTKLHGQVGELAIQLEEAHAVAEGAQQQLQQERQEATAQTTALRGALNQIHGQMEELRSDHETLQQAHRRLVAKDLMNSGILKDRYVADLFTRLQEAEWKLDVARKRACTWGYEMMVPLGRIDRGIQTQYAEVWAAEQQQQQQEIVSQTCRQAGLHPGHNPAVLLPAAPTLAGNGSSRRIHLNPITDAGTGMSATVGLPSPQPNDVSSNIQRKKPAFASHKNSSSSSSSSKQQSSPQSGIAVDSSNKHTSKRPASADTGVVVDCDKTAKGAAAVPVDILVAAEELLATGTVEALSAPAVLQLISSLYAAKAAADAAALRNHKPAAGLWGFVVQQLQKYDSSKCLGLISSSIVSDPCSSEGDLGGAAAIAALAQLLLSVRQHAASCKEVAQFQHALLDSQQQSLSVLAQGRLSSSSTSTAAGGTSSSSDSLSNSETHQPLTVIKGSWGEIRLDNSKLLPALHDPMLLLPDGLSSVVERILLWPGMMALLGWVAEGHFLCGLEEDGLGKTLMDVQAPHVHFLLLEAADIMGLHPLPRVQISQSATPYVRLLRVPVMKVTAAAAQPSNEAVTVQQQQRRRQRHRRQKQLSVWQRESLLVLSSAALQLLQPAELQAAIGAALVPVLLADGQGEQVLEGSTNTSSISAALANLPALQLLSPSCVPGLSELATLASLLVLQPSYLLTHLPPEMHAMGGALAAALQAADRVVAVAGDRGGLLVSQDLGAAVAAVLKTSGGSCAVTFQVVSGSSSGSSAYSCSSSDRPMQEWMQRVQTAGEVGNVIPDVSQLLPHHESLFGDVQHDSTKQQQCVAGSDAASSKSGGAELDEDQVLLLRLKQLRDWSDSQQYHDMMAAAKPLRRVMPPTARKLPSA